MKRNKNNESFDMETGDMVLVVESEGMIAGVITKVEYPGISYRNVGGNLQHGSENLFYHLTDVRADQIGVPEKDMRALREIKEAL